MRHTSLETVFVEFVPREVLPGVLYLALEHATAVHLCACGCGTKVVTPLHPTGWQLYFDGDAVTLTPSIGNWQFACRSHYWVRDNQVEWAAPMTEAEVAFVRREDARTREGYFARRAGQAGATSQPARDTADDPPPRPLRRFWRRLRRFG